MKEFTNPLPLLPVAEVAKRPKKILFVGKPYVVWKAGDRYFASSASCAHRGADLSEGRVCDRLLECPYHGWTLAADGQLFSPFENRSKGKRDVFPLTSRFGFLWLNGDEHHFQELQAAGGEFIGPLMFRFKAPLHITLDNFCDGAHLPYVHARNGANRAQVGETRFEWSEDAQGVNIVFDYAQRPRTILSLFNLFLKTRWHVEARVEFDPIRVKYTIYWYRPRTKTILNGVNGNTFYLYPAAQGETAAPCLVFQRIPAYLRPFKWLVGRILRKMTQDLMYEDVEMASRILAHQTGFEGLKLEKFDAPIVRVRQRMLESDPFAMGTKSGSAVD